MPIDVALRAPCSRFERRDENLDGRFLHGLSRETVAAAWRQAFECSQLDPHDEDTCSRKWCVVTILVVDDEAPIRDLLHEFLDEEGHTVVVAGCAAEAMDLLQASPTIRLMVTDVLMPGMNGIELAERATELRPDLQILLVSGSWSLLQQPTARWPVLEKPFRLEQLLQQVQSMLC